MAAKPLNSEIAVYYIESIYRSDQCNSQEIAAMAAKTNSEIARRAAMAAKPNSEIAVL